MSEAQGEAGKPAAKGSALKTLRKDVPAALINAVVSVPDGLASAALAGVNPVYGLYTSIAAPTVGSSLVSAQLMQISTTSASALAAGQAVAAYPEDQRAPALFLLVVLIGLFLAVFGFLRLGRLVRFVSHAVMTGFLTGVAVVLVLDQLAPLMGVSPEGANALLQFADLIRQADELSPPTLATGLFALILALLLQRTPIATFSSLAALVVPTLMVLWLGWDEVTQVEDVSAIPRAIPMPALPDFSLMSSELLFSAVSIAVIIAVQGAGVSQSVPNPDGSSVNASRDMIAQGAANVASGLFSGIPAGGSVGQTALNVSLGARSRWAGILAGIWMLAFVLLVPGLVGLVPMTVLAALMILAGVSAIDIEEAQSIWNTGGAARWSIVATFLATLVLSIPMAVATGVILTVIFYVASSARDVTVRALIRQPDGRIAEAALPERLPSNDVTVIEVYGSLFFAGARTLADSLPRPEGAERPVVVLRLRGHTRVGATLIEVLDEYADDLAEAGGRLYLSGVDHEFGRRLNAAGKLAMKESVWLVPAEATLGASTEQAAQQARAWLGSLRPGSPR